MSSWGQLCCYAQCNMHSNTYLYMSPAYSMSHACHMHPHAYHMHPHVTFMRVMVYFLRQFRLVLGNHLLERSLVVTSHCAQAYYVASAVAPPPNPTHHDIMPHPCRRPINMMSWCIVSSGMGTMWRPLWSPALAMRGQPWNCKCGRKGRWLREGVV